jgi:manganese/zinc/iron transport system ATP- binding protein
MNARPATGGASPPLGSEHSADAALCIHDMTVAYQKRPVLWDVDLDVPRGSLVGVLGPNGAGKSTLIKAVIDQVPRASGSVLIFGGAYRERRDRIGYVPQRESVDWDFPVSALDVTAMGRYGKIGWFGRVKRSHRELALQAMERVGIAELANRQISQLSGGQQQRTFLARALVQDADLYLMDEPFAGVDAATEHTIVQILRELRDRGKTVLVVHHDLQTVREYFDRVILLNMRVVAHGTTEEVFHAANLQKTYGGTLTLLAEAAEALQRGGVRR